METISGVSNWQLVVRREAAGITILYARTCDERASLPEELFGLPVIALGPRALAANRTAPAGEEVLITCGRPGEEWDNAKLRELTLPPSLRRVGDYAFLNCFQLRTLRFHDGIAFWGGSCFMNCRLLDTFDLTRAGESQGESLAYIADELSRELDVTIRAAGGETARVIFPEYIELYEENVPNHHFDYNIYGAGYPYHRCFQEKRFHLTAYDLLWPQFLKVEHQPMTAIRMAYYRLRCPLDLTEGAGAQYRRHLEENDGEALRFLLESRDTAGVAFLLRQAEPGKETLSAACDLARELHFPEALAVLLEEQHKRFPAGRAKTFDL